MSSFNDQFLYSILIIIIGYVLKRFEIIKPSDGEGLARIIFNLTLPALIVVTFNDIKLEYSLFLLIIINIVYCVLIGFLTIFLFRKHSMETKGMLTMLISGFNIGLFAYPLVEGIWGREGIKYFGMFDVGNAFIVFGFIFVVGGFYAGEGARLDVKSIVSKLLKSIPFMTYILVVILNVLHIKLPTLFIETADIISWANMPLSLLLLGIYLNFRFDKSNVKLIVQFLSLKYIIGLTVGLLLFFTLPFDDMFKYTVLIGMILPTSASVLPYAVYYKYNQKLIGTASNLSIVISFILMWLIANFIISV